MDPLEGSGTMKYDKAARGTKTTTVNNMKQIMASNLLFPMEDARWYDRFNRYGWINPFDTDQISKEFLFFTKPDLNLFTSGKDIYTATLNPDLAKFPIFKDAVERHKKAMCQLQSSIYDEDNTMNPFMCLLSNAVTSKMDLPGISSDTQESTNNIYGTTIQYRSHSIKSDNAFDFSLSFTDTAYLEIYTMVKIYDEYMRLQKMGEVSPQENYIIDRVLNDQFSIYKFLVGSDGETILYYAKATGVYFVDVPRSDFGDPGNAGFNYSLSFHANFVEDMNPLILSEFNRLVPSNSSIKLKSNYDFASAYDYAAGVIDNSWVKFPYVKKYTGDPRAVRRGVHSDYRLKWTKPNSTTNVKDIIKKGATQ